ncbi:TIGR02444 family protein [Kushneria phosphatilytica]|nr:TIGR02444 family protein [Kushneria phosphatilytica]
MPETAQSNRFEPDLRRFALTLYGRPGVEAACLTLQDEGGLDVCELLWRCWLAHHGLAPGPATEAGLADIRRWQREMTAPLRHRRRRLKSLATDEPRLETLRTHLKRAELESELEALTRLQALAELHDSVTSAPHHSLAIELTTHYHPSVASLEAALTTLAQQAMALPPWPEQRVPAAETPNAPEAARRPS